MPVKLIMCNVRIRAKFLFCLASYFAFAPGLQSQVADGWRFQSLTIHDGLSQGFVSDITQDKRGVMWLATGDGLNKYDGYNFTVFHHDPQNRFSLSSDDLTCVLEDSRGILWIGTRQNGLDMFDRANNRFLHLREGGDNSLRSNNVMKIMEDGNGVLWIRTRDGIDRLEITGTPQTVAENMTEKLAGKLRFTHIDLDSATKSLARRYGPEDVFVDSRNRVFITTPVKVLELLFKPSTVKYELLERYRFNVIDSAFIPAMIEDTVNRNLLLNTKEITRFPGFGVPEKIYQHQRNDTRWTVDRSGNLWLPDGEQIVLIDLRTNQVRRIVSADAEQKKAMAVPTVCYTDRTGVVWIGTGGYGLLRYDPELQPFHHLLPGSATYQMVEDTAGNIITSQFKLIGMNGGSSYVNSSFIDPDLIASSFPRSAVYVFSKDKGANLWMGIHKGLISYNIITKKLQRIELPVDGLAMQPFPVYADSTGNIWMGYNKYFLKYNVASGQLTRIAYPLQGDPYDYDFLQCIYQDGQLIWLGTVSGVFCYDTVTGTFKPSPFTSGANWLPGGFIYSFCRDSRLPDQYIWIGTKGGGLNRLDKKDGTSLRYDTKKGLANNVVYGILPDDEGHLWLSTNKGISRFSIDNAGFQNFDETDGLQGNEFNRYAYLKMTDGTLVFGGMNGINHFNPRHINVLAPPPVIFTELRLFNKPVEPAPEGSPLKADIAYTKEVRLRYEQNVLTIQFAAVDYRKHGNIRYRYRMEGFDGEWIYSGKVREATYTNLDPGNYEFAVQASFNNGEWGEGETTLLIHVHTPWWRTWWFYALLTATTAALLYLLYRFRLGQLRRLEKLRNNIARDLHDEVGSSISTIAIYSKIVHEQVNNSTFDNEPLLKKISDHASDIMESMNDIVWNINTKNDAFEHIITRMRTHASELLEAKNYILHFRFDENLSNMRLSMEKRRDFYLVYKEVVNNVAKYADGKNAWISLTLNNGNLELSIRDDGRGFDMNNVKDSGNGIGNIRFRASALKGKVHFASVPVEGTHVYLIFPVTG